MPWCAVHSRNCVVVDSMYSLATHLGKRIKLPLMLGLLGLICGLDRVLHGWDFAFKLLEKF